MNCWILLDNCLLKITRKSFRIMVSPAGIEPATHALKVRCSTN